MYDTLCKYLANLYILLFLLFISACATVPGPPDERDPFESYNRAMFAFNEVFDENLLRPVAETYHDNMPDFIQTGVSNFFSNLDDVLVFFNDLLQFKFKRAASDLTRFVSNSIFGVFGLMDVATDMGLPKHNEDFGQTLASWGVSEGPYLVLPFLASRTVRDTAGLVVDWQVDPVLQITDKEARWTAIALEAVDTRVQLLTASKILDQAALDKYIFVRDAYLQRRKSLVYDGNPPREKLDFQQKDEDLELELELERESRPIPQNGS